jgi:hypothetical protein
LVSVVALTLTLGLGYRIWGASGEGEKKPFTLKDEALTNHKTEADYPEEDNDIWKYMDGDTPDVPGVHKVLSLNSDEVKGRNTWLMWCGGNEAFWDWFANHSYGLCDFLKVLDSRERGTRFAKYGLMSEPGFKKATAPDQWGLWLDQRDGDKEASREDVYGLPSGIVGLRLFKNPNFFGEGADAKAARDAWDGVKFYGKKDYYQNPKLIRPYRVGMACAFCHVGPHPLYPPENPESPKWENLSSSIGSQYFKVQTIFAPLQEPDSFIYQHLASSKPGTLDTSLIPTDSLNNPNTMNAIFNVFPRLKRSFITPAEKLDAPAASIVTDHSVLQLPEDGPDSTRHTPHVLVDGADSIGISGALSRVFINIGTFHEYWIKTQNPLVGGRKQEPFEIANAREGSVYWRVTEKRTSNLAKFFLKEAKPMPLAKAPGGASYLTKDSALLERGKVVFAENCMRCHSSKQPSDEDPKKWPVWNPQTNLKEWEASVSSEEYHAWARAAVQKPDFLEGNFLSIDQRFPVNFIGTNACRACGTNSTRGHVWDNFSSETYKASAPVTIKVYDPVDGGEKDFTIPGGGPGYYRVPTLISLWATAPYFHNNALGKFNGDPSVKGRMECFDDSIRKLLWPERREHLGSIWRTDRPTTLVLNKVYAHDFLIGVIGRECLSVMYPWLVPLGALVVGVLVLRRGKQKGSTALKVVGGLLSVLAVAGLGVVVYLFWDPGELTIGPIPAGTPVNLLSNLNTEAPLPDLIDAVLKTKKALAEIKDEADQGKALQQFLKTAGPALLKVNKCPDFVEDRGHEFGTKLPEADKLALIEFLKTF